MVRVAAWPSFAVAALAGVALVLITGEWWLLGVGALAVAAAWFYTGGSRPYGYRGLGELSVFVFFGLVAVVGTTYVQVGRVTASSVISGIAIGCSQIAGRQQPAKTWQKTRAAKANAGGLSGLAPDPVAVRATGLIQRCCCRFSDGGGVLPSPSPPCWPLARRQPAAGDVFSSPTRMRGDRTVLRGSARAGLTVTR